MLVSANGRYPKTGINAFVNLCKEQNLVLIEDSAQALGSFYPNGKHIGTVGYVGSFSFSAPKVISTGQGGAVVTNDEQIADKVKRLKNFEEEKEVMTYMTLSDIILNSLICKQ